MEFDPRMTEETKQIVDYATQLFAVVFKDVHVGRQVTDTNADESKVKFDNIEEKEFLADSLYDDYKIPVTAYIPKTVSPTSSIVVFYHGGGFRMFSRKTHRNSVAYMADYSNKIWVSVEYRLAPEHKHPTQVQDCISATKWVLENKTKALNASTHAHVGVCGDSAGGMAATSVALELRGRIAFQILIYPWLDMTGTSEIYREFSKPVFLLTDELLSNSVKDFLSDMSLAATPGVSPVFNNNLAGLPRCLIVSAELDPLLGDSYTYHKKLQEAGVSSEMYVVKGAVHNFFQVFLNYKNAFIEGAVEMLKFLNRV